MFPTVVVDHWTRRIHASRRAHHAFDERVLTSVLLRELGKAHALVHGNPRDDAWVVVVASDRALPLRGQFFLRLERPLAPVWHLFPNHHIQTIAPVKPTRV